MQQIPIQAIPSQSFTYADPEANQWGITIRVVSAPSPINNVAQAGQVAFSFTLNGTVLIQNITAVPGSLIIPYNYLVGSAGNFIITTQSQQVANYSQFGLTQALYYLEPSDLETIQQSTPSIVTASDFNPLGGLPLRFAPVGYVIAS